MITDAFEVMESFRGEDEFRGGVRRVMFDATDNILEVTVSRDSDWTKNQDSVFETRTFRLVEVRQEWVEVDRD